MFDAYPFKETVSKSAMSSTVTTAKFIVPYYFENLEYIASVAKTHRLTAGYAIQAAQCYSPGQLQAVQNASYFASKSYTYNSKMDARAYITMQLYSGMAYGYTQFGYFTYRLPNTNDSAETYVDAPVIWSETTGADGKKTPAKTQLYDYVQSSNTELIGLQQTLSKFEWLGTQLVAGSTATQNIFGYATNYGGDTAIGISAQYDCVAGNFAAGNRKGYLVANADHPQYGRSNRAELTLGAEYSHAIVYAGGQAQTVRLSNGKLSVYIGCGEGVFVIPV